MKTLCAWPRLRGEGSMVGHEDLLPCANALLKAGKDCYTGAATFRAVKEKYSNSKFDCVATRRLCDSLRK